MNNAPIGIFDSGSGGLSIYQSIVKMLPLESFVYLGDHAYLPYGEKSTEFIKQRVVQCIEFLNSQKVKLIVVACNSATVAGIDYFRSTFPELPIIGVVPVVKTAAQMSKTKHFVVLSTKFTANSVYQKDLIKKWAPDCLVSNIGSSSLVPLIEDGRVDGSDVEKELKKIFQKLEDISFDVVVLGCTHYPFVRSTISAIVGDAVKVIDSGDAVARQVQRVLAHRGDLSERSLMVTKFFTTGDTSVVAKVFSQLLNNEVKVTHVSL